MEDYKQPSSRKEMNEFTSAGCTGYTDIRLYAASTKKPKAVVTFDISTRPDKCVLETGFVFGRDTDKKYFHRMADADAAEKEQRKMWGLPYGMEQKLIMLNDGRVVTWRDGYFFIKVVPDPVLKDGKYPVGIVPISTNKEGVISVYLGGYKVSDILYVVPLDDYYSVTVVFEGTRGHGACLTSLMKRKEIPLEAALDAVRAVWESMSESEWREAMNAPDYPRGITKARRALLEYFAMFPERAEIETKWRPSDEERLKWIKTYKAHTETETGKEG